MEKLADFLREKIVSVSNGHFNGIKKISLNDLKTLRRLIDHAIAQANQELVQPKIPPTRAFPDIQNLSSKLSPPPPSSQTSSAKLLNTDQSSQEKIEDCPKCDWVRYDQALISSAKLLFDQYLNQHPVLLGVELRLYCGAVVCGRYRQGFIPPQLELLRLHKEYIHCYQGERKQMLLHDSINIELSAKNAGYALLPFFNLAMTTGILIDKSISAHKQRQLARQIVVDVTERFVSSLLTHTGMPTTSPELSDAETARMKWVPMFKFSNEEILRNMVQERKKNK